MSSRFDRLRSLALAAASAATPPDPLLLVAFISTVALVWSLAAVNARSPPKPTRSVSVPAAEASPSQLGGPRDLTGTVIWKKFWDATGVRRPFRGVVTEKRKIEGEVHWHVVYAEDGDSEDMSAAAIAYYMKKAAAAPVGSPGKAGRSKTRGGAEQGEAASGRSLLRSASPQPRSPPYAGGAGGRARGLAARQRQQQ